MNNISLEKIEQKKKEPINLDNFKVYCVDLETSGLKGVPNDIALSIGVSEVDLINQTVKPYYDAVLGYDVSEWDLLKKQSWIFSNSNLSIEDVMYAYDHDNGAKNIANKFMELMENKPIAIYNVDYDYRKFLRHSPFNMAPNQILPCVMMAAMDVCCIPGYYGSYKWPTLSESVDIILDTDVKSLLAENEAYHDASYDVLATGYVLLKLIELGHYDIMKYTNASGHV